MIDTVDSPLYPCCRQRELFAAGAGSLPVAQGRALLVNIDADVEVSITRDCGVTGVPTLKLCRRGEVVATRHGYPSE